MPKVRTFVLLTLCLALVWSLIATPDAIAGKERSIKASTTAQDMTYYEEVIEPALNAGSIAPDQVRWLKNFQANRQANERAFNPRRDDGGGPDDFGHTWKDSDEDEVDFEWVDITEDVDPLADVEDDWNSGFLDLGWTFSFYGEEYDQIAINSNGWVSFTDDAYIWALWAGIPSEDQPDGHIAVLGVDLDPTQAEADGAGIYFMTDADEEMAIITWQDLPTFGNGGNPQTCQLIITQVGPVGFMKMQYNDEEDVLETLTIGCENSDASDGLEVYYGDDDWAELEKAVVITTVFPDDEEPFLSTIPENFDFGDLRTGTEETIEARLVNSGLGPLTIDSTMFTADDDGYISADLDLTDEVIGELSSSEFTVTFAPELAGEFTATITIYHDGINADEGGMTEIVVTGEGAEQSVFAIDPESVVSEINSFETQDHELTISNEGGLALEWAIVDVETVEPDDERGPRRDDAGDEIEDKEFDVENASLFSYKSLAYDWDNNYLWWDQYNPSMIKCFDLSNDFEEVASANIAQRYPQDLAWLNGIVYATNWSNNRTVQRYALDEEGEIETLDNINVNFAAYGCGQDVENEYLILLNLQWPSYPLHFFTIDDEGDIDEEVGVVDNWTPEANNLYGYNIEFVPAHSDVGQFWNQRQGNMHQILIDMEEFEAVEDAEGVASFRTNSTQYYEGAAHDKWDLWCASYNSATVQAWDDGVSETYWLGYTPEEGVIEGGESDVLTIVLTPGNSIEGSYSGDIWIETNDPDNELVSIGVDMEVTGVPMIDVYWPTEYGFVDVNDEEYDPDVDGEPIMDFNAMFDPNLFSNYDMEFPFTIENFGTAPLTITGVDFDGDDVFRVDDDEVEIAAFSKYTMLAILNAEDSDEFFGTMTINSDADNVEGWEVEMTGTTKAPPQIVVEPGSIEEELDIGENTVEVELTISNEGEAPLTFEVEHEVIREPLRDREARSIRRAGDGAVPRRDEAGDEIEEKNFEVDNASLFSYKSLAYDWDNDYLWWSQYNPGLIKCFDLAGDFEEVASLNVGARYPQDLAWMDGITYAFSWTNNRNIHRYALDQDGEIEQLDDIIVNFTCYGVGQDVENEYLIFLELRGPTYPLHFYTLDDEGDLDEEVGTVDNWVPEVNNMWGYNLEFVPKHADVGQLWNQRLGNMHQVLIDMDEFEAVENEDAASFRTNSTQYYEGAAHDGFDLWCASYNSAELQAWDDGVTETYWLGYDLKEGEILPDDDPMVMTVTLNSEGLHEGLYEAEIYFISNDPADPNLTISVELETFGIADMLVYWDTDHGYNAPGGEEDAVVSFNMAHDPHLFTGAEYSVPVTVENPGSAILHIDGITGGGEDEYFYADPDTFLVHPETEVVIDFVFNADLEDPGEWDEVLTLNPRDDVDAFEVMVHAAAEMPPIIGVEPLEVVEDDMVTGEVREIDISIFNEGVSDLYWWAEIILPEEEEGEGGAPRRDEVGDEIEDKAFEVDNASMFSYKSLAYDWDNNYLWWSQYNPSLIRAFDLNNYEEVAELAVNGRWRQDIAWLNGVTYACSWTNNRNVHRYAFDENGDIEQLDDVQSNFSVYGVGQDVENEYLILLELRGPSYPLHFYSVLDDGDIDEEVGVVDNWVPQAANMHGYNVEFVPAHADVGQLWNQRQGNMHQVLIDMDEFEAVENEDAASFRVHSQQWYEGAAHDGFDLWCAAYNSAELQAYDDGITETYWIGINPEEGIVEAEDEGIMVLTLDGRGIAGDFEAEIYITSNDKSTDLTVVDVAMSVTPVPDLVVEWDFMPDFDDPDFDAEYVIDWNDYYAPNIFVDESYEVVVTLINEGTADLEVTGVESDEEADPFFTSDWDENAVILEPDEEMDVTLTFLPTDNGEYGGEDAPIIMQFFSDDPLEETKEIPVHANAFFPPRIELDPNELSYELLAGDIEEEAVSVINRGDALLVWESWAEIIREAERDGEARAVRRAGNGAVPRRDDAGDEIEDKTFDVENASLFSYKSLAYDWDNDYLWWSQYNPSLIKCFDLAGDFEEVASLAVNGRWPQDMAWMGGIAYAFSWTNNRNIHRYALTDDGEIEQLDDIIVNFTCYGIAQDVENEYLIFLELRGPTYPLHFYTLDDEGDLDEEVGTVDNWVPYVENQWGYNLEFVPKHSDVGQLWNQRLGNMHQVLIDMDEFEAVDSEDAATFRVNSTQYYEGAAHDGHDLWCAQYNSATLQAWDDGVTETYWLGWDPREGEVEGGELQDVTITLNTTGLYTGRYTASLHFESNDPEDPDVELFVDMEVEGVGRIRVEVGGPEEDNEPVNFGEVYIDYPETITLNLINVGTDELVIEDFVPDGRGPFDVTEEVIDALPIVLGTREDGDHETTIDVIFDPQEAEEFNDYVIHAFSDDPAWPEEDPYPITLNGIGLEPPEIRIDVNFLEVPLRVGEEAEEQITVENIGGSDLVFEVEIELDERAVRDEAVRGVRRAGDRAVAADLTSPVGPSRENDVRRDDAGDEIEDKTFDVENASLFSYKSLAYDWDNDYLWWSQYNPSLIKCFDLAGDYEEVASLAVNQRYPQDLAWLNGIVYATSWTNNRNLHRYALDGDGEIEQLDDVQMNFSCYGVGQDVQNEYLLVLELSGPSYPIHFFTVTDDGDADEEVGRVSNWVPYVENMWGYNLEFVPKHAEVGQLWNQRQGNMHQVLIDMEEFEAVDSEDAASFRVNSQQYYEGAAHDGYDLWCAAYNSATLQAWDDGVAEAYWISVDPKEGTIVPNDDESVFVLLNTEGLLEDDYEATLHFYSNDPENPDVTVDVLMIVEGFPYWSENREEDRKQWREGQLPMPFAGEAVLEFQPTLEDDNAVSVWGQTGSEDVIELQLANAGSAVLELDLIEIDNEDEFSIDFDDELTIEPYEVALVNITFNPTGLGVREGALRIWSNAENEDIFDAGDPIEWELSGIGQDPAEIWTDPEDGSTIDVAAGLDLELVERVVTIGNREGEWRRNLRWNIDIEEIEEEVEEGGAPRRDEAGDEVEDKTFEVDGASLFSYKSLAYDWDNNYLWWDQYNPSLIKCFDLSNDFEEVATANIAQRYPQDLAWLNGIVYATNWSNNRTIQRYALDEDGEIESLDNINVNFSAYGIGQDVENEWLILLNLQWPSYPLHIFTVDDEGDLDEEIGTVDNWIAEANNLYGYNVEWVFKHADVGQFWNQRQGNMHQILIDTEEWAAVEDADGVESFRTNSTQYYEGAAHDGFDLWCASYNSAELQAWEDGIEETYWILADPKDGEILPDETEELTITLNTDGLENFQVYEADVFINWNDPLADDDPGSPVTLRVTLTPGAKLRHFHNDPDMDDPFELFEPSDAMATLHITDVMMNEEMDVPTGWEIGVFAEEPEDNLSGAIVWQDEGVDLIAYGADGDIEGFSNGDDFLFRLWDPESGREFPADGIYDENVENNREVWVQGGESWLELNGIEVWEQTLDFANEWSLVSMHIDLTHLYEVGEDDGPDMEEVLSEPVVDEEGNTLVDYIKVIKNVEGDFCVPEHGFWGIDYWDVSQGYWVNVPDFPVSATWTDVPVGEMAQMRINDGWNMIAYWPGYDLPATERSDYYVLSPLMENEDFEVRIAKNGAGQFLAPAFGFSNMDDWTPGLGYQVNVDLGGSAWTGFAYPEPYEGNRVAVATGSKRSTHWTAPAFSSENMSVLVKAVSGVEVSNGDQIAAYNKQTGELVGVGTFENGLCGLPVWGDVSYDDVEGTVSGTSFDIVMRYWNKEDDVEMLLKPTIIREGGQMRYVQDNLVVLDAEVESLIPDAFAISQNYPNPFNAITRFNYDVPEDAKVTISVFDVSGRLVQTLVSGEQKAGRHVTSWEAHNATSGLYIVTMKAPGFESVRKVMLVK